jgi:hypothetical protein
MRREGADIFSEAVTFLREAVTFSREAVKNPITLLSLDWRVMGSKRGRASACD